MVLLNDNANLFGVNPAVTQVAEKFDFARLWAYPSENSDELRARIGSEYGVSPEEVIVGNGSDELLDITSKCFINPGDVFCSPAPTFGMYKFYARVNLATIREKILRPDFALDPDQILSEDAKLTAICQPNNPTANLFASSSVRKLLEQSAGIVLVDEAYADFSGSSMLKEVMNSGVGIDIRTFSKAYGLAGLRGGYAISRKELVDELRRVRTPFGLNSFSEAVMVRAFDNRKWVRETVDKVVKERAYLSKRLQALGIKVYPSVCNFVIGNVPGDGPLFVEELKKRGVAVRDCNSFPMLKDHIRVTVAPRDMLDKFLVTAEAVLEGK
jgi:histidinol-phosphate aminotransferase